MRGRKPVGPEFVHRLTGSDKAKQRAEALLKMMTGEYRVTKACAEFGIKEARLDQIRIEGFQALVTALEDKPAGRPAHTPSPAELENEQLRAENARLQVERDAALVRAEVAVALPRVGAELKKKTTAPRPRQ